MSEVEGTLNILHQDIGADAEAEEIEAWLRREILATVHLRLCGDTTADVNHQVDVIRTLALLSDNPDLYLDLTTSFEQEPR